MSVEETSSRARSFICQGCGAQLNIAGAGDTFKCQYCGTVNKISAPTSSAPEKSDQLKSFFMLAKTALAGGNNQEALKYYNKILETDPTVAEAWVSKGIATLLLPEGLKIPSGEAIICFKNAISNDPQKEWVPQIVKFILDFCPAEFAKLKPGFVLLKGGGSQAGEIRAMVHQLMDLLKFANEISPRNTGVLDALITINREYMLRSGDMIERKTLMTDFKLYIAQMKEIDPNYKPFKGGCFIATAAAGDEHHPDVVQLRAFRNQVLEKSKPGLRFIDFYYTYSPPIAEQIKDRKLLAKVIHASFIKPLAVVTKFWVK